MRLNQFIARATGLSRRAADQAISEGRILINGQEASVGSLVGAGDEVSLDQQPLKLSETVTIMLNKPVGYVCSRDGQGSPTIYELLPGKYHQLKPVGRLDKDSSGLLVLTNDGQLANQLTHPRYAKQKVYQVQLDKALTESDMAQLNREVVLEDGPSRLQITTSRVVTVPGNSPTRTYRVVMSEGRNRQIRRSFAALGYSVTSLERRSFGEYHLESLKSGRFQLQ